MLLKIGLNISGFIRKAKRNWFPYKNLTDFHQETFMYKCTKKLLRTLII